MRVIAQDSSIDIDYETYSFIIDSLNSNNEKYYTIKAFRNGEDTVITLALYKDLNNAKKALLGMSQNYTRYLITDNDNLMTMTDAIDCELDRQFNKIEIQEIKATAYKFPEEGL